MERGATILFSDGTEDSGTEANANSRQQDSFSSYEVSTEGQSEGDNQNPGLSSEGEISTRHPNLNSEEGRGILHPSTVIRGQLGNHFTDEKIRKDAQKWAASFQGGEGSWTREDAGIYTHRNRSKKRKAIEFAARNHKFKRLKGLYNDEYRQILNGNIGDAASRILSEGSEALPESQIGMIIWTSVEKECLFAALERLGKDDIRGIASRIGTKSEIEVREYVLLLHQGVVAKTFNESRRQLLGLVDMPAAVQISPECCDLLNKAADALAFRQEKYEEQLEQKKWGDSWLLNAGVNRYMEERMTEDGGSRDRREFHSPAEMLNLGNWLELSSRVFMNPGAPFEDENWQTFSELDEEPAIRATAFADFQNLATIITKRLVSATIFYAMSRLRAMDSQSFHHSEKIRRGDVEAAAKVIGLDINSKKFWAGCPRRCHLTVYRTLGSSIDGQPPIDYSKVEEILNNERIQYDLLDSEQAHISSKRSRSSSVDFNISLQPESETSSGRHSSKSPLRDLASEYIQAAAMENKELLDVSSRTFENAYIFRGRKLRATELKETYHQVQDEYAEAIDLQASLVEEQKLWDILGQDPPFTIKPEDIEVPDYPRQQRKDEEDVRDWRDQLQFRSQWETFERPIPGTAFSRPFGQQSGGEKSVSDFDEEDLSSSALSDETEEEGSESVDTETEDEMGDSDVASSSDEETSEDI